MEYKVRKINSSGKRRTPAGKKRYTVGDIYKCVDKAEYDFLLTYESHHWEDATEHPVAKPAPIAKPKTAPKTGKGGGK